MPWKLGSWMTRKGDDRSPNPVKLSPGKHAYRLPECTELSLSEFAQIVRGKTLGQEIQFDGAGPTNPHEVQCLLVHDYLGDLNFVRPAVGVPPRALAPFASKKGVGWLEMKFHDTEWTQPQYGFLLLDLRNRHRGERGFLESIGHGPYPESSLPRVILAAASEQFLGWKGVDPQQCWHLRSCQSPEDLSAALQSFLNLCSIISDWPVEKNSPLGSVREHVLMGKTNKD